MGWKPLKGETAVITGGSGGIGSATALELARAGADVVIGYKEGRDRAEETAKRCRDAGADARVVRMDMSDRASVEQAIRSVCSLRSPSILVHAAGISRPGLVQDVTDREYDEMMDVHVRSAFHLVQAVLPGMLRVKRGRIILVTSIWGETGGSGEVLYSAAKGAQIGMVKALGKELAPSGITVNAVSPGAISTPMLDGQLPFEDQRALAEEIPAGRLGRPDEVASLIRYLCLPEASYITGQILRVNGGWYT
ncbi:elongation factor P 5-aminopentanone reductase [Staphylospora marina]|uniref:elongation factor P 5-aminopentanone reductase n=1 Tax=Staphylospora marina TaxID=2490858 RepID=UPI000F5BF37B|nr:SDR family oxidoreductase [Staphylospora marina]